MIELNLELDSSASQTIHELMHYYNIRSRAELVSKAIDLLTLATHVDKTNGELFARKGTHETKIILR